MAGGMSWTEEQLAEYEAKQQRRRGIRPTVGERAAEWIQGFEADPGPESDLQGKIEKWCEEHGYPYFHDKSKKCNSPGVPDCIIAMPGARTLWLELKSKDGRLSKEQKQWRLQLMALGHEWHLVKSYRKFMQIVNAVARSAGGKVEG